MDFSNTGLRMFPTEDDDKDYPCQICGLKCEQSDVDLPGWVSSIPVDIGGDVNVQVDWCSSIRLLCDPDDEFGQLLPDFTYQNMPRLITPPDCRQIPYGIRPRSQASDIEVHEAEYYMGSSFERVTRKRFEVDLDYSRGHTADERVYIPVHTSCLEVARKVTASSRVAHVRSMRGLFLALHWREGIATKSKIAWDREFPNVNYMLASHGFYLPHRRWNTETYHGMDWPGPHATARENLIHVSQLLKILSPFEAHRGQSLMRDPLKIEDLTTCLLKNLQPCRLRTALTGESRKMAANIDKLPREIVDAIFDEMGGQDLPRVSSHLVP